VGPFSSWQACGSLRTDADRQVYALSASADGRRLAVLDTPVGVDHFDPTVTQQSVAIWDLTTMTLARRIGDVSDGSWALDVDLSPDGALLAVTGDGSRLVRVADGSEVWHFGPPPSVASNGSVERNFAFSPDGTLLAAGTPEEIEIFAVDGGASVTKLPAMPASPGLAFSPDGTLLASSGAALWQTAGWANLRRGATVNLDRLAAQIIFTDNWATFTPNSSAILIQFATSTFMDGELVTTTLHWHTDTEILDAATGTVVKALPKDLPRRPSFSPDGRWLLAGNQLTHLETGAALTLAAASEVSVFLPDGRIAAPLADDSIQLFCPAP
jgi:WD40 repeat protein